MKPSQTWQFAKHFYKAYGALIYFKAIWWKFILVYSPFEELGNAHSLSTPSWDRIIDLSTVCSIYNGQSTTGNLVPAHYFFISGGEEMSQWQKFLVSLDAIALIGIFGCCLATAFLPSVTVANWRSAVLPVTQREQAERVESPGDGNTATQPTPEPTVALAETNESLPSHGDEEPQSQQGHPSLYVETGTEGTRNWTLKASDDEVVIIGGFCVDNRCNGVYKAIDGPTEVEVSVTDGFGLVIVEEWARNEFCFRVEQAQELGWAHDTVEPLPSWEACD